VVRVKVTGAIKTKEKAAKKNVEKNVVEKNTCVWSAFDGKAILLPRAV